MGQSSLNNSTRVTDPGPGPYGGSIASVVTLTASTTIDSLYADKTILLSAAAGLTVTLPAATGSGNVYRFYIKTTVTSNNYVIQVANSTDAFNGFVQNISDDPATVKGYIASAGSDDTITLNGTTKGGLVGAEYVIRDIASGLFQVMGRDMATGTEATPFSAAV